jgi:uncharacterized protein
MVVYRRPGVYFDRADIRPFGIGLRRTDIAGLVGIAARGPLHQPVKVESWAQFVSAFGGYLPQAYLAYAVAGFFANGGRTCWVVRVADPGQATPAYLGLLDAAGQRLFPLLATSPGTWGQNVRVLLVPRGGDRFSLTLAGPEGAQEVWRDVSLRPQNDQGRDNPQYIQTVLNDPQNGSHLVKACAPADRGAWGWPTPNWLQVDGQIVTGRLAGGSDGLATLTPEHLCGHGLLPVLPGVGTQRAWADPCETILSDQPWGLTALEAIDEVSIVVSPDIMPRPRYAGTSVVPAIPCEVLEPEPEVPPLQEIPAEYPPDFTTAQIVALQTELIGHCEKLRDRMAVLDSCPRKANPSEVIAWRGQFDSKFAALYYPWLMVPDPLQLEGLLRLVPPCGHVAGVYARVDQLIGVHKPPANEVVEGVMDVAVAVADLDYEDLNDQGVDLIRAFPGRGLRVAGARTLSSEADWRYVNVRRLLCMIEESIAESTQWTVFEPNNQTLWFDVDRLVRSFLDGLWRLGMLDGATAGDAYLVKCDESTNPPEEEDLGRMTCLIGVQPPWPAEFVIVRIGKTVSGTEILEMSGSQNA